MTINFIDLIKDGDSMLESYKNSLCLGSSWPLNENVSIFLSRKDGWYHNREIMQMAVGKNVVVYTNDETLLDFAEYIEEEHTFNVNIMTDITGGRFVPVQHFYPNIRKVNSLLKMYYTGVLFEGGEIL